jgi:hypothetical protein
MFREAFGGKHGIPLTADNVFAVLSMMFWAVTIIVSLKYVVLMLRFDNQGEGGVLALLSWAANTVRHKPALLWLVTVMGAFSASLFYGDAVITPAISVLSAVEGITVAVPEAEHFVVPLALAVLIGLFAIQRRGTAVVGAFFGPIMSPVPAVALGLASIARPRDPQAINPVMRCASSSTRVAFSAARRYSVPDRCRGAGRRHTTSAQNRCAWPGSGGVPGADDQLLGQGTRCAILKRRATPSTCWRPIGCWSP